MVPDQSGGQEQNPADRPRGAANEKSEAGFPRTSPDNRALTLVAITATATSAAKFATATAASARTLFARASDVDGEGAAVQLRAIQGVDGLLRLFGRAHRDEAEPTRFTRHAVHHQVGLDDRPVRREGVLEIVFGGVEGKISNKQFCTHVMFYCATNAAFTRLFPTIGFQIVTETSSLEDLPCRGIDKLSNSGANMNHSRGIANSIFINLFVRIASSLRPVLVSSNHPHCFRRHGELRIQINRVRERGDAAVGCEASARGVDRRTTSRHTNHAIQFIGPLLFRRSIPSSTPPG